MSRFYVKPEDVKGDEIWVSKEEAHHIVDVMRLASGDEIVAFDGTGKEYVGKILNASVNKLIIGIEKVNRIKTENKLYIALAQAIPKKAKMDFITEKATELGVDEIIPVATGRTIVRLSDKKQPVKKEHWQNIAISSSKQCGRLDVPKVRNVVKFSQILKETKNYDLTMLACLDKDTTPLKNVISDFKGKRILVMVGPEGDFSPDEINSAKNCGAKLVSLGSLVLKSDTASLFILSILNYENSSI